MVDFILIMWLLA